jgi:hypothetical protein
MSCNVKLLISSNIPVVILFLIIVTFRFDSYVRGNWEQPESGNYTSLPIVFFIAPVEMRYYFRSDSRLDGKERGA